ncbi:MAG: signal peptidase II [Deltaproteobacteria bacterium]|nr:signal peptidase II [Deltaproteobacteria bacterium]
MAGHPSLQGPSLTGPKAWVFFGVFGSSVLLDQLTKWWVVSNIALYRGEVPIIPGFLSFIQAQNPGAAFSMLRDFEYRIWLFIAFGLIAAGVILDLWRRLPKEDVTSALSLGLILGGAVGNLIDRVHKQTVTDFVRMYTDHPPLRAWLVDHFGTAEWPTYNVADMSLLFGVGLFLMHYLFLEDKGADA